jgi:hypothetical protein
VGRPWSLSGDPYTPTPKPHPQNHQVGLALARHQLPSQPTPNPQTSQVRAGQPPPSDYFRPFSLSLAMFGGRRTSNIPAEMSHPQRVEKDLAQVCVCVCVCVFYVCLCGCGWVGVWRTPHSSPLVRSTER